MFYGSKPSLTHSLARSLALSLLLPHSFPTRQHPPGCSFFLLPPQQFCSNNAKKVCPLYSKCLNMFLIYSFSYFLHLFPFFGPQNFGFHPNRCVFFFFLMPF